MNGDVAPEMRRDLDPRHHHQQPQQQSASAITSPRQLPEQNSGQRYTSPDHQGVQQPQPPVKPPTADDTRDAASVAAERRRMRRRQQSVGNDSGAETGPEAASTPMRPTTPVTPTSGQHQRMRTRPRTREEARQRAQTPESPLAAPPFHQGGYLGQTQPPAVAPIATNITKPVKVQTQPLVDLTKIPSTATKSETAASSPRFTRAIQRNTPTPLSVDLTKIPVTPVQMVSPRSEAVKSRSAQPVAVNHQPAATRQDDPYDGYSSVPIGQSAGHRQVPVSAPAHKGAPGPRDGYAPYTAPHGTAPTINGTAPRMMASPGRQTMTSPQAPMYNGPAPVRAHTPSGTGPQSAYQHRTPEPPPYSQYQDHPNPPQQRPQPVPHSPDVRIQTISKPTKSKQRRPKSEYEELEEFDESAYLRGRVPLITGEPATRRKALPPSENEQYMPGYDHEEDTTHKDPFDEQAFLQGKVSIFGGPVKPHPPKERQEEELEWTRNPKPALQDLTDDDPASQFDESAFLPKRTKDETEAEVEWKKHHKPALQDLPDGDPARHFDESAFIQKNLKDKTESEAEVEWRRHHKPALQDLPPEEGSKEFDEFAFLGRQRPAENDLVQEDEDDIAKRSFDEREFLKKKAKEVSEEDRPEWTRNPKPALQDIPDGGQANQFDENIFLIRQLPQAADENDTNADGTQPRQFDEDSFLSGRAPSGPAPPDGRTKRRRAKKPEPEKKAPAEEEPEPSEPFDESDYLMGRVPLLKGSTDPAVNPPRESGLKKRCGERALWQHGDDSLTDDEFDEDAYLRGRIPVLRQSVDKELLPRREVEPRRRRRQRAEWERADDDADDDIDSACSSDAEFDERAFLRGRVATVRRSVERDSSVESETFTKIPSRSFRMLRRSVSRDHDDGSDSGRSERCLAPETRRNSLGHPEDMDPDKAYNSMVYVGKKIPSKRFGLLKRSMDRKAESLDRANDPIEKLKTSSNAELDVDTAVEKLEIGKYDPDQYMDLLKKTIEEPAIKVEVEPEVTDF